MKSCTSFRTLSYLRTINVVCRCGPDELLRSHTALKGVADVCRGRLGFGQNWLRAAHISSGIGTPWKEVPVIVHESTRNLGFLNQIFTYDELAWFCRVACDGYGISPRTPRVSRGYTVKGVPEKLAQIDPTMSSTRSESVAHHHSSLG